MDQALRKPFDVTTLGNEIEGELETMFHPKAPYKEPILNEREAIHGDYSITAFLSQQFKAVARTSDGWRDLSDVQRESFDLFATKMARILNGNPDVKDHWDDIAGYAKLISERLK